MFLFNISDHFYINIHFLPKHFKTTRSSEDDIEFSVNSKNITSYYVSGKFVKIIFKWDFRMR